VIYRGNLLEIGPGEEVIQKPKHPYTQALLDALPKFGHWDEVTRYDTLLTTERDTPHDGGCSFYGRCKVAHQSKCIAERPHLRESDGSHLVACFYA